MSEQQWTKEPWLAEDSKIRAGERLIALVYSEDGEKHRWFWECGRANRDRIVACVNACTGIPNPAEFMQEVRRVLEEALSLSHALDPTNGAQYRRVDQHQNSIDALLARIPEART